MYKIPVMKCSNNDSNLNFNVPCVHIRQEQKWKQIGTYMQYCLQTLCSPFSPRDCLCRSHVKRKPTDIICLLVLICKTKKVFHLEIRNCTEWFDLILQKQLTD